VAESETVELRSDVVLPLMNSGVVVVVSIAVFGISAVVVIAIGEALGVLVAISKNINWCRSNNIVNLSA